MPRTHSSSAEYRRRVIADAFDLVGEPVDVSPSWILERQVERLAELGYNALVGVEAEYVLYHAPEQEPGDGARAKPPRAITRRNGDYEITHHRLVDTHIGTLVSTLVAAGVPVEAFKTESAGGQIEATFAPSSPVDACDDYTVFKLAAKRLASDADLLATFMAVPEIGVGSGLHLHISLHSDDGPAFAAEEGTLTDVAEYVIAGLLDGLRPLMPFLAPTVNSYRRFRPHTFAPTAWCWGLDNRTCAVRVMGVGPNRHLEIRVAGADANAYLALAAAIASIVDGIAHEKAPPMPVNGSAYLNNSRAERIAVSLADALADFQTCELPTRAFGQRVVEHYARFAEIEIEAHREQVTESELQRGLEKA